MQDMTGSQLPPADEWVTLTTRPSLSEADMLRLRLETNGIAVFIADELTATVYYARAGIGVRVQVPKSELHQAVAIYKNWDASRVRASLPSCPSCQSTNTGAAPCGWRKMLTWLLVLLAACVFVCVFIFETTDFFVMAIIHVVLVVFYLLWFLNDRKRFECCDCKHTWKPSKKSHEPAE